MRKWTAALLLAAVCLMGCAGAKEETPPEAETGSEPEAPAQVSAGEEAIPVEDWDVWCVYWDTDADVAGELDNLGGKLRDLMVFACYYDEKDALNLPREFPALLELPGTLSPERVYLTVVNDVVRWNGNASLKDPQLAERILSDEDTIQAHIEKLLSMAERLGCTGVEMDYENMKDPELLERYTVFIRLLWEAASARGMGVRILLEPGAPVEAIQFPEGPEYVVMCYNLYGTHSGPGPKADRAFLKATVEKFSCLPSVNYALANGGFDWGEDGAAAKSLTKLDAEALLAQYGCQPERDPDSFALHFSYDDSDGRHTVWYADEETLLGWRRILENASAGEVQTSLWRAS